MPQVRNTESEVKEDAGSDDWVERRTVKAVPKKNEGDSATENVAKPEETRERSRLLMGR